MGTQAGMRDAPIFLLGMTPKVGTNYLSRLLCLHGRCVPSPIPEDFLLAKAQPLLEYVDDVTEYYGERDAEWGLGTRRLGRLRAGLESSLGEGLCHFIRAAAGAPGRRVVAKTPWVTNAHRFFELFPDSPLIVLIRDGRATVSSMSRWFQRDFAECATIWAQAADEVHALLSRPPKAKRGLMMVRYEDLFRSTDTEMRKILKVLGLANSRYPFAKACALPVTGSSFFSDPRDPWRPRKRTADFDPLFHPGSWTEEQERTFAEIAGAASAKLGYR